MIPIDNVMLLMVADDRFEGNFYEATCNHTGSLPLFMIGVIWRIRNECLFENISPFGSCKRILGTFSGYPNEMVSKKRRPVIFPVIDSDTICGFFDGPRNRVYVEPV